VLKLFFIVLWGLVFALSGCSQGGVTPKRYAAVIDGIESAEGVYFTTREGSAPLWHLHLRVENGSPSASASILKVQVLDRYDSQRYGDVGDSVSFVILGSREPTGTLLFEDLSDYRVVSKATRPNKSVDPTASAGTSPAEQPLVPASAASHL
jgi:hypothetical protein